MKFPNQLPFLGFLIPRFLRRSKAEKEILLREIDRWEE